MLRSAFWILDGFRHCCLCEVSLGNDITEMTSPGSRLQSWKLHLHKVTLLLLCLVVTSQNAWGMPINELTESGAKDDRWLADQSFYDFDYGEEKPQADGPELANNGLCPPVPKRLPAGGCELSTCSSDRECADRKLKCCYNGCIYTCLPELKPAPYFDWIREPVRRLQFGQSWLVPGPNSQTDAWLCSTSPAQDDSDPLVCPHGHECSIDDPGRPAEGVPNKGHCVKSTEDISNVSALDRAKNNLSVQSAAKAGLEPEDSASQHACHLEEQLIVLSGHSVTVKGQTCKCEERQLLCNDALGV